MTIKYQGKEVKQMKMIVNPKVSVEPGDNIQQPGLNCGFCNTLLCVPD